MSTQLSTSSLLQNTFKLITFTLPLCIGSLINMISSFAAMFIVAKLGVDELAAGALAVSTFITISMIVTLLYAIGILIGHSRGQGRPLTDIGDLVRNGFWLAVIVAIPTSIFLWNISVLLLLFKQDIHLVKLTQHYFHYAALAIIPLLINTVISQFYIGIGFPRFTMITSIICLPATILLSYGFILGKFGLPKMALAGVGCSAFIVQSSICVFVFIYMCFNKRIRKYEIFSKSFFPSWPACKDIIFLGYPIFFQCGGELAAMTVFTYFMGYFGATALAASQIASQYSMLIIMVILSLSQALSILSSEAYGNKNFYLIKQYMISSLAVLSIISALVLTLFILAPRFLMQFFLSQADFNNKTIIHFVTYFFILAGITLFVDGVKILLSGGLRALHDSNGPMKIGIVCIWIISLPMSYIVAFHFNGGPIGLRIGFMSGFFIASILLGKRMVSALSNTSSKVNWENENVIPSECESLG